MDTLLLLLRPSLSGTVRMTNVDYLPASLSVEDQRTIHWNSVLYTAKLFTEASNLPLTLVGSEASGAAIIGSLQALTEAGKLHLLPKWVTPFLLDLQQHIQSHHCQGSLQKEVAYIEGSKVIQVPRPLRQHGNTQLQSWYALQSLFSL